MEMSALIANAVIIIILLILIPLACLYIYKEKKKGSHCIGCPMAGNCQKKGLCEDLDSK